VQVRHSAHRGLNHQKSVQLASQGLAIFGSSNWTSPSSDSQEEHNYFTTKSWIVDWFGIQFHRKWSNAAGLETKPFQPLPPDRPAHSAPAHLRTNVPVQTALVFDGGPFAHLYDIYLGTTPDPPLLAASVALGPREPGRPLLRYALPPLAPGTTYYWRIVGRTMALQEAGSNAVWTFTTGDGTGAAPPGVQTLAAGNATAVSASLNALVNPNASATTVRFEYGLTTAYGGQVAAPTGPAGGSTAVAVSAVVSGLTCNTTYNYRVVAENGDGTASGGNMTFRTPVCPDDRVILGLGTFARNGGWIAAREGSDARTPFSTWLRVPWASYNDAGGSARIAVGDVDGDGLDEIVAGLGRGGDGWLAVFDDGMHGYAIVRWIRLPWEAYNASNGEIWPALGDLDGDGRAEIVAGLGPGGAGRIAIFDDAATGYAFFGWRQVAWPSYIASGDGATHPAVGNVDGAGASEIVVGLGRGGGGWLEVVGDASSSYAHRGWVRVGWPLYNRTNGTTFPAAGDLDGDGRAEIVAGLGRGGAGWLEVFEDAPGAYAHRVWLQASWPVYDASGSGQTHPAVGNVDGDSRAEIVIGLDRFGAAGGWFETFDDASEAFASVGWRRVDWGSFNAAGGAVYPAIGRFR
jgi:hypothetical protein